MFRGKASLKEKFTALKQIGYDGIELNSPGGVNKDEAIAAGREVGLPIHGVVCSTHWKTRLSDPNPEKRKQAVAHLKTAVRDAHKVGGSAVLLVPGKVNENKDESQQQVWDRSTEGIRQVLPLASRLGIHILIENVWNGFCYKHNGPADQTADKLAEYIDHINSPWVGSYFDIGNHQKYGKPAEWIRTLGRRIVKLDVKDWGKKGGFTKIGDGDVDWAEVRKALKAIGFTGWATSEVRGGDRARIQEVHERMTQALGV
ncbi:MAG: sugar phosphate isomerase/epimerase family protein [Phycisphaeraceae bacterium]|nr:sugar phosphate isomerase/epimerase family protein [Phycisphaeraceae bacterium]